MFTVQHLIPYILLRLITFAIWGYQMLAADTLYNNWLTITFSGLIWGGKFGKKGLISNPFFARDLLLWIRSRFVLSTRKWIT
jgi:hypothetical protein